MSSKKIVFIGTPEFACAILRALKENDYNVIAVVSQPDKPVGRKHILEKTPVHALADEYGIPVLQPVNMRKEADSIIALGADLIITCAYGQFVPEKILKAPEYGCLNIHPSLLPKYRGGAPVHRAVWNGDTVTGVCLMEMVKEMDAGKVYARCETPIDPDDTTETLNLKLERDACELMLKSLPAYFNGELEGVPQDTEGVVLAPNISKEDEQIHFAQEDVHQAYNHLRALIDWPVSYGLIGGKRVKFYRAEKKVCDITEKPGTVLGFNKKAMEIACTGGILRILELQMEGKSKMSAEAFANGAGRSLTGKIFE